jgi:anti-anti-sigma factor
MARSAPSARSVFVGRDEHGDVVITPAGDLDSVLAPTLHAAIRRVVAQAPRRIVFDFEALTFLDSAGCRMLDAAWREARTAGVRFALCSEMAPIVRTVLVGTLVAALFEAV